MTTDPSRKDCTTLEHVLPVSKGGEDTYDNCVAACAICNSKRSNHDLSDDYSIILKNAVKVDNSHQNLMKKVKRAKSYVESGGSFEYWYSNSRLKETFKNKFKEMMAEI